MTDPFRDVHRARMRSTLVRLITSFALVGGLGGGLAALATAAPPPLVVPDSQSTEPVTGAPTAEAPQQQPGGSADAVASVLPAPAPTPATAPPDSAPVAQAGPRTWSIAIDTTGYQTEIDQCLWVRMDLGVQAPIVGAHNHCGGSVVLDMAIGDTVTLAGTGLDGTYVVAADRDARAGDNAREATAGFDAVVILQTCHWADDGTVRLVALLPARA